MICWWKQKGGLSVKFLWAAVKRGASKYHASHWRCACVSFCFLLLINTVRVHTDTRMTGNKYQDSRFCSHLQSLWTVRIIFLQTAKKTATSQNVLYAQLTLKNRLKNKNDCLTSETFKKNAILMNLVNLKWAHHGLFSLFTPIYVHIYIYIDQSQQASVNDVSTCTSYPSEPKAQSPKKQNTENSLKLNVIESGCRLRSPAHLQFKPSVCDWQPIRRNPD